MLVEFQRKRMELPSARFGYLRDSTDALHGSTTNTTNRFRISCDVRFQPASEPMDERWAGRDPSGHYARALVPMAESRKRWGL